jgi:hypothetical protein
MLEPGSLLLQDLGYFALPDLRSIDEQHGYFLTRLDLQAALFEVETEKRIDLPGLLSQETRTHFELDLLVGAQEHLPCRVLFVRLVSSHSFAIILSRFTHPRNAVNLSLDNVTFSLHAVSIISTQVVCRLRI